MSSLQLIMMFFKMSEWRHRDGIRLVGKSATFPSAPRQSEWMVAEPVNFGLTLLAARRIRCMAIRPSSSPRQADAAMVCSGKEPMIWPRPLLHSKIKAAEQMLGYHSLMYEPSVTATHVPASMASSNQWSLPTRRKDFHIHVQPHSSRASRIVVGIVRSRAQSTCETIVFFHCSTVSTVQSLPQFSRGWPSFVISKQAAARVDQPSARR